MIGDAAARSEGPPILASIAAAILRAVGALRGFQLAGALDGSLSPVACKSGAAAGPDSPTVL